jgi:hypothetical protein
VDGVVEEQRLIEQAIGTHVEGTGVVGVEVGGRRVGRPAGVKGLVAWEAVWFGILLALALALLAPTTLINGTTMAVAVMTVAKRVITLLLRIGML